MRSKYLDSLIKEHGKSITKSEITKAFNVLRKFGYLVAHFNDNRRGTQGNNGYPDMTICGHGYVIFCEVKIGKDVFSPDQMKWKDAIEGCSNHGGMFYFTVTELNYKEIVDKILTKNL